MLHPSFFLPTASFCPFIPSLVHRRQRKESRESDGDHNNKNNNEAEKKAGEGGRRMRQRPNFVDEATKTSRQTDSCLPSSLADDDHDQIPLLRIDSSPGTLCDSLFSSFSVVFVLFPSQVNVDEVNQQYLFSLIHSKVASCGQIPV